MIQITLTFTTLAAALRTLREIPENTLVAAPVATAAVAAEEKAAVLEAPGKPSPASPARGPRTAKAEAPAPAAPEKTVDEPASQPAAESAETAPPASTAAEFAYQTLANAVNAGVPKHGKAKLLAIAAKHGAENFKALAPTAWAAAHADVVALG